MKAEDLVEGDVSQREGNGSLNNMRVHLDVRGEEAYNFEVEEDHNYYVSEARVLVHNEGDYDLQELRRSLFHLQWHAENTALPLVGVSDADMLKDLGKEFLEEVRDKGLEDPKVRQALLKKLSRAGVGSRALGHLRHLFENSSEASFFLDAARAIITGPTLAMRISRSQNAADNLRAEAYKIEYWHPYAK